MTGVIFSRKCADLFHPKTIRSTMGSVYRVPAYFAEDLSETVEKLRGRGIRTCAAHLGESAPTRRKITGEAARFSSETRETVSAGNCRRKRIV